ncbi:hypothetical protein MXMO3_01650 [Maritalea myrionectae]|uniref:ATP-grasp domain-containing protein n=1 Tax=Maritalea myrionectae TaxID=454601 RepID=A0A2R4MDR1_9HYPH|nr:ATP-grasp domain-containing protein [Maritalea myrionectae]AVX04178.1 hypothetical protein MXMO3_01650 [Maritalea myrionectae]
MSGNKVPQKGKRQTRVLLIGDDMRSFLASARSLGRLGVEIHAAPFDWHAPALASKYIKQVHYLPRVGSWTKSWLSSIQGLQEKHKYDLVIPCCERSLLPLYAQRDRLSGVKIAHPGDLAMTQFFDKIETRDLANSLDIPVAKGEAVDSGSRADLLVERYGLPLMLKARRSYSAQSLEVRGDVVAIKSKAALERALAAIDDENAYFVEQIFPQAGEASGLGVSVAARDGKIISAFQHRRITEKPGGGSSSVRISEALDADLLDAVTRLSEAVRLNGLAMYEFRQSVDSGEWVLLEVNARPWGSMPLPLALGIDFPAMFLDVHLPEKRVFKTDYREGIVGRNLMLSLIHYMEDKERSNRYFPLFAISETLKHMWRCARRVEVSDSFVWDDLRPALFEYVALGGRFLRRSKWFKQGKPERRVLPSRRDDQQYVSLGVEHQLDSQFDKQPEKDRKVS